MDVKTDGTSSMFSIKENLHCFSKFFIVEENKKYFIWAGKGRNQRQEIPEYLAVAIRKFEKEGLKDKPHRLNNDLVKRIKEKTIEDLLKRPDEKVLICGKLLSYGQLAEEVRKETELGVEILSELLLLTLDLVKRGKMK
jgi:hypothetical protein